MSEIAKKTPFEKKLFNMDFSGRLKRMPGGTIITTILAVEVLYHDTQAAGDVSVFSQSIDPTGKIVQVRLDAGTINRDYHVKVKVRLNDGQEWEGEGILRVEQLAKPELPAAA